MKELSTSNGPKKHIVLIVPRGEAVRNFLYSDTVRYLSENARVTLLTVIDDERFNTRFRPHCEEIIHLKHYPDSKSVKYLRAITDAAHDRWICTEVARNRSAIRDYEATTRSARLKRFGLKVLASIFANRYSLQALTALEVYMSKRLPASEVFVEMFKRIKPDLVFNCSHIHGPAGELPLKVAHSMGIPTVGFVFSWDNLTSRSRIFVPYDYYLVWNEKMRDQLLNTYPSVRSDRVLITGTPQFDFHFKKDFYLEKDELCRRIGADPKRPFILYTTGIDKHFPQEHLHVELVAKMLQEIHISPKPQLVVRTYVKGTSPEMKALATKNLPGVVFPPILWEENWFTPLYEDLSIYTNLLRHTSLGINAASTVSLELLMHNKPVINLGFDPPGSKLDHVFRFERHINFDHYRPVVESGATMLARSSDDMREMLMRGLSAPDEGSLHRKHFIEEMFGSSLDGCAGERIAQGLIKLAEAKQEFKARISVGPSYSKQYAQETD